jgi:hypothetical protein
MQRIMNHTKRVNDLSVMLKRSELKGIGVYAKKSIKKGDIIAYYKLKIFDTNNYTSPTDRTYAFTIYDKSEKIVDGLIGDIDFSSLSPPIENIPFWGPFINEPSGEQIINVDVDYNLDYNYRDKSILNPGDYIIYKFVATMDINEGDEITWYYGKNYCRNYEIKINKD